MKKFPIPLYAIKSFMFFCIIILLPGTAKCQNNCSLKDQQNYPNIKNESTNDSSASYDFKLIGIGYQKSDYKELFLIGSNYFLNIAFKNSEFYHRVEDREIQIGLFNEYGIKNLSIYFDFGPEVRMLQNLYIVPSGGVSLSLNKGLAFIFFDSYIGTKAGYLKEFQNGRSIEIESGIQFHVPETEYNTIYLKIGVGFNSF